MIYVLSGGGSGGTLEVTAPAGVTVTATKSGKTYTRTTNAQGKAVFKGLASGTWQLSISDGSQTSTPVSVMIEADYTVTLAFFSATINITYPAGAVCTATNGTTTFTAPNTGGTWALTVPNAGTWTIACSTQATGQSKSAQVLISSQGESKSVTLSYALVLYDAANGGDNTAVTGGWEVNGGTLKNESGYIGFYEGAGAAVNDWDTLGTKNTIDASNYTKLKVVCTKADSGGKIGLSSNKSSTTPAWVASQSLTVGTITVDISNVNSTYFFLWQVFHNGNQANDIRFSYIALEN